MVLGLIELQNKRSATGAIVPFADSDAVRFGRFSKVF